MSLLVRPSVGATGGLPLQRAPDSVSFDSTKTVKSIPKDSLAARLNLKRTDTVTVVKHEFNHRQQIITGSIVMACLAGILAVMNNYNPR